MTLFDALNVSSNAISVHRMRSEVSAENMSTIFSGVKTRKAVDLAASDFSAAMNEVRAGGNLATAGNTAGMDAVTGGVRVQGIRTEGRPDDERAAGMKEITEMMSAKSAYELNVRVASMLKSMALAALEIGRGA